MTEYKASKVYEMGSRTDVPYWLVQAKDGRAVVGLETEREADAVVESLNDETAKLQAELDAAKAEIARLREGLESIKSFVKSEIEKAKDIVLHTDSDGVYSRNQAVKFALEKLYLRLDAIPLPSTSATDVTLNDDTQKLPELDEQLPFDGSPEHTPKFKVGDKVICTDFYGKETIMWITSIDDSPTVMNGVVIPEQGVTMRLENEHESTILHESFLRHAD